MFAAGGLPINESLFGILTDVKLLELSNADLPVLGQLALRAPAPISIHMQSANWQKTLVAQLAQIHCWRASARSITTSASSPRPNTSSRISKAITRMIPASDQSAKIITSHVTYGSTGKGDRPTRRSPTLFLNITAPARCTSFCAKPRRKQSPARLWTKLTFVILVRSRNSRKRRS